MKSLAKFCKKIADNPSFQSLILFLIILTAVSMGFETVPELTDTFGDIFLGIYYVTQAVFAFEIIVRLLAHAPKFRSFFKNGWNSFDTIIVILSFVPGVGSFALIGRLLRALRLMRLFSSSDRLRKFVDRLKESFDEALYAGLILFILGYIFTIAGHYLFFEVDPERWGTFWNSLVSVFYLGLFQNVKDSVSATLPSSKGHLLYFIAFYFTLVALLVSTISASIIDALRTERD